MEEKSHPTIFTSEHIKAVAENAKILKDLWMQEGMQGMEERSRHKDRTARDIKIFIFASQVEMININTGGEEQLHPIFPAEIEEDDE